MKYLMAALLSSIALLGVASHAAAELVTIDPDNYPNGTSVSNLFRGVSLRALRQPYNASSIYSPTGSEVLVGNCGAAFPCGGHNGTKEFKGPTGGKWQFIDQWNRCANLGDPIFCLEGFSVMEIVFDTPTDLVQLETAYASDAATIIAYHANGKQLFKCSAWIAACTYDSTTTFGPQMYNETLFVIKRHKPDIARIVFAGAEGMASIGLISFWLHKP